MQINKKIELRETQNIGKGFFAKQQIMKGQQLMTIQNQKFITCNGFSGIYQFSDIKCKPQISTKTLFAYFLSVLYVTRNYQQQYKDIFQYFDTLPKQLHGLVNWSAEELSKLQNEQLVQLIKDKKQKIEKQLQLIKQNIKQKWSKPKQSWQYRIFLNQEQIQLISIKQIIYFYSVIQSRVVYYQCQQDQSSSVGALAPNLQLFNHSENPQCQVTGDHRFIVKTIKNIKKDQEIFVSYGRYTVQKYLQVYGFIQCLERSISERNNYRKRITIQYNKLYHKNKSLTMQNTEV